MKAIFFDFDGTLLNSLNLYREILIKYFSNRHVAIDELLVRSIEASISIGGHELFSSIMSKNYSNDDIELFRFGQLDLVEESHLHLTSIQINQISKKFNLFLFSSKPDALCTIILDKLNISESFTKINGLNGLYPNKPSPQFYEQMKKDIKFDDAFFIGDSDIDYLTAEACDIDYFHCAWGYGPTDYIDAYHKVFYSPTDLFAFLVGN